MGVQAVLGVFSKPSHINVGDKNKPEEYGKKPETRSSLKGKQFLSNPTRSGTYGSKLPEVYLEKKHPYVSYNDPYQDRVSYAAKAKEEEGKVPEKSRKYTKKKGFWTSDFPRRDEFTLNITTEQYRERLAQEGKYAKHSIVDEDTLKHMREEVGDESSGDDDSPSSSPRRKKKTLYDMVYTGQEPYPTAIRNSMVAGKDTQNPTQLSWEREYGEQKPLSRRYGEGITHVEHSKPQFARVPIVRNTFYRTSL